MISSVRPTVAAARPLAASAPRPAAAAAPAQAPKPAKPVVAQAQPAGWTVGRMLKTAGAAAGGFVAGGGATVVADLFLHFGNNGGVAWPGGIYLAAAGAVALGAAALYAKLSAK
jgi:hypothetical protein